MWSSARWPGPLFWDGDYVARPTEPPRTSTPLQGPPLPAGRHQRWGSQNPCFCLPLVSHPSNPTHPCRHCMSTNQQCSALLIQKLSCCALFFAQNKKDIAKISADRQMLLPIFLCGQKPMRLTNYWMTKANTGVEVCLEGLTWRLMMIRALIEFATLTSIQFPFLSLIWQKSNEPFSFLY